MGNKGELEMESYEKIVANFKKLFGETKEPMFAPATEEEMKKLRQLVGDDVPKFLEFYEKYQPQYGLPTMDCYLNLCDIDSILTENLDGEPGEHLAKYGVFAFATTVGGDLVCIDTNNCKEGDPAVLIASHTFCFYNDDMRRVELYDVPESVSDEYEDADYIPLNYANIKKCLPRIEKSFIKFMDKLSRNQYEDIEEEYLDFD